jgi:DNA ligase-1
MNLDRRTILAACACALAAPLANAAVPALERPREAPDGLDPAGFLVSEKLDGVRAVWDGRALVFRSGLPVFAPAWFTARLPAQPLDGELWLGRGRFEALAAAVRRRTPLDAEWRQLRYAVFDLPGAGGPFGERAARIERLARDHGGFEAVAQSLVADRAALLHRLDDVVRAGGEGLVLHRAAAPWRPGRGDDVLKLKPLADADALVVGHVEGRGRLEGLLGALRVRGDDGAEFLIGTGFSDADRRRPPAVGATVTYTYRGVTAAGVPRFASFVRERPAGT